MINQGLSRFAIALIPTLTLISCVGTSKQSVLPQSPTTESVAHDETKSQHNSGKLPQGVSPIAQKIALHIDPTLESFSGTTTIKLQLNQATQEIVFHSAELAISDISYVTQKNGQDYVRSGSFEQLNKEGRASVRFEESLPSGEGELRLRFKGNYTPGLHGLYKVKVDDESYAFTQFEAISARRAFPCFDEPRFKISYTIEVITRQQDHIITTTPEVKSEEIKYDDGTSKMRHQFKTTKALPTYLLSFSVGPFDIVDAPALPKTSIRNVEVPFRGVAVKGKGQELKYALQNTSELVESLENYFNYPFPFEKLDIIAVPDFRAGAMENVGAITFRDYFLFIDENTAPMAQKTRFVNIMAHELAHMWFGNLVTMPWWDDIWLNEAFATWMAAKVVEDTHPEFEAQARQLSYTHWAMDQDSFASSRQIREPIESDHDIYNAFDGITYSKGASVLSMVESWMGQDDFRKGMREYMRTHAYQNADYKDLIQSLDAASPNKSIPKLFESFLFQPGVPHLHVNANEITQRRYRAKGSTYETSSKWTLPLCASIGKLSLAHRCALISEPKHKSDERFVSAEAVAASMPTSWGHPNTNASGYYRWSLNINDLSNLIENHYSTMNVRERMSFRDSLFALFRQGDLNEILMIRTLPLLMNDPHPLVWSSTLNFMHQAIHRSGPQFKHAWIDLGKTVLWEKLDAIGLQAKRGESALITESRPKLVSSLIFDFEHEELLENFSKLGVEYLGPSKIGKLNPKVLASDLGQVALQAALQVRGKSFATQLRTRLSNESDPVARRQLIGALSSIDDPNLQKNQLPLILSDDLRDNEITTFLFNIARRKKVHNLAWDFVVKNIDKMTARVPARRQSSLIHLLDYSGDLKSKELIREFFRTRIENIDGGPRQLELALEAIDRRSAQDDLLLELAQTILDAST